MNFTTKEAINYVLNNIGEKLSLTNHNKSIYGEYIISYDGTDVMLENVMYNDKQKIVIIRSINYLNNNYSIIDDLFESQFEKWDPTNLKDNTLKEILEL